MTSLFTFRAQITALVIAYTTCLGMAHATDSSLYDWRPCPSGLAEEGGVQPAQKWDLTLSPYTHHWNYSAEHRPVKLVALDNHLPGGRFCGMAAFTNSFGQPSAYVYVGQQWDGVLGNPKLFSKLSAGVLWGYRHEYSNKIPFNNYGIAPAIIPSLGYAFNRTDSAQVFVLGNAGLLFAYGHSF
jgi:hypothetical protein